MTLGNVRGQVLIGRVVNISIPVQLDPGEAASTVCVEVEVSYADNRLDGSRVSSGWQNPEATGEGLLLVRTSTVVDEPVIGLNLRAGCVRRTERRYVLLADVPAPIASGGTLVLPVVQPVAPVAATPSAPLAPAVPALSGTKEAAAQAVPAAGAASGPSRASLRSARRAAREEAAAVAAQAAAAKAGSDNAEATARLVVKPAPQPAPPPQAPKAPLKVEAPPAVPAPVAAAAPATLPVAAAVPATPQAKPPVKAAVVAPPPPVVAAPEAKSRLKLEALPDVNPSLKSTLELVTSPSDNEQVRADAKALWQSLNAQPGESLQESQRLRALDSQNKALQETAAKNQAVQDGLKSQLAKAEEERYTNGLVGGLAALLVCAAAGAGYLWVRMRRLQAGSNKDWWRGQSVEPSILSDLAPVNDAATTASQRGRESKSGRDSKSGRNSRAPDVDLGVDESIFDSLKTQPSRKTARKPSRSVAPSALDSMPPRNAFFNSSMGARSVNVEELFDIQQQAEFFVSLGQHDQAIELLRQHIYGATGTSGLAYLDLLQLYHRFNRRQEYDQLRDEFNHSFNAQVPQFEHFNQQTRGLEHYTSAIERIVALWKSPRILQVLQDSIFRKPEVGDAETFDLEAYRELLLLFAIAKEVSDANPGVTGAAHDSSHAALGRSSGQGDIPSVFSTARDAPLVAHTTPLAPARQAPLSLAPVSRLEMDGHDSLSEPDFVLPKASPRLGLDVDLFELESVVAPLNVAEVPSVDLSLGELDLPLAAPSPLPPVFSASSVELDLENYLNDKKNAAEGRPKT